MLWIFLADDRWNDKLHLTPHRLCLDTLSATLQLCLPHYPVSRGTAQLLADMLSLKEKMLAFRLPQYLSVGLTLFASPESLNASRVHTCSTNTSYSSEKRLLPILVTQWILDCSHKKVQ